MPNVDATAATALAQTVVQPAYFGFLDFVGDPLRATTYKESVTFAATGDPDLDGFTFDAMDPQFIDVSEVSNQQGGSDTVTITVGGILEVDADVLNIIGDKSKWYRRTARLWMRVHDEAGTAQGAIIPYKTGYMTDVRIVPTPETQVIVIEIENYLVILKEASHRNYLNQGDYDAADISAKATVGSATGARTGPAGAIGTISGGGGSAGRTGTRGLVDRL